MELPIFDLHCDLLSYLAEVPGAHPSNIEEIGCALPRLAEGRVKLQVLAVYAATGSGSTKSARHQIELLPRLLKDEQDRLYAVSTADRIDAAGESERTGVVLAIENASCFCEEGEPLDRGLDRLGWILDESGPVLYVSPTHLGPNRFGGGAPDPAGLSDDGRVLLDFLDGRGVALDLSHASDALAREALEHIDRMGSAVPVLASHSNYRAVCDHARNLPDDIAAEIIRRGGVIGFNFIRDYVHADDPGALRRHVEHGLELGGGDALAFGADFFSPRQFPVPRKIPFFFPEHEHAGCYPPLLRGLADLLGDAGLAALAHRNVERFLRRVLER